MDDWNACCLQWWFLQRSSSVIHPTDLTLGLASLWFSKWFLSVWFSLSLSLDTIRSVKLYILTSQTARLTFRKGVIIKFRCRNYQNFGWLASSEHDRPNLLELKAPFDEETFPKYFSSDQNIFDCQLFCRGPVEIILRPLAGRWEGSVLPSSVNISVTVRLTRGSLLCRTDRLFNRQTNYNQLDF